jgi:hypothetical protein
MVHANSRNQISAAPILNKSSFFSQTLAMRNSRFALVVLLGVVIIASVKQKRKWKNQSTVDTKVYSKDFDLNKHFNISFGQSVMK